ncbi:MAG TPA: hypothetical protein VHN99_01280 [Deinococcales bacterium]|nr:hypothetical protein [Deinococcales bacterium]
MNRRWILATLIAAGAVAWAATSYTFTVNGSKVNLKTMDSGGVVYVDALAFAKALGATATYDAAKHAFTINTPKAAPLQDVAGTAQLAGGDGVIGKTYSLGKGSLLNFTLTGVEYRIKPVLTGANALIPQEDEKLLLLHFTVQNPQTRDVGVGWSSIKFTAVDKIDVNHPFKTNVTREGTSVVYGESLKPAQKISLMAAIAVPAEGPVPKLIVQREDGPVVRYDLRDQAKVPAPWADPADPSGATALAVAPGVMGTPYTVGLYDVTVQSAAFSTDPMESRPPAKGKRYLVATINLKYAVDKTAGDVNYSWGTLKYELTTNEGDRILFNGNLVKPTRDAKAEGRLSPGEETQYRVYFPVDEGVTAKSLRVQYQNAHAVAVDLSGVK